MDAIPALAAITLRDGTLMPLPAAPQLPLTRDDRVKATKLHHSARALCSSGQLAAKDMDSIETYYHDVCRPDANQPAWARRLEEKIDRIEAKIDRLSCLSDNRARVSGSGAALAIVHNDNGEDPTDAPHDMDPLQTTSDIRNLAGRSLKQYYLFYGGVRLHPTEESMKLFVANKIGCLDLTIATHLISGGAGSKFHG